MSHDHAITLAVPRASADQGCESMCIPCCRPIKRILRYIMLNLPDSVEKTSGSQSKTTLPGKMSVASPRYPITQILRRAFLPPPSNLSTPLSSHRRQLGRGPESPTLAEEAWMLGHAGRVRGTSLAPVTFSSDGATGKQLNVEPAHAQGACVVIGWKYSVTATTKKQKSRGDAAFVCLWLAGLVSGPLKIYPETVCRCRGRRVGVHWLCLRSRSTQARHQ